jgi:hypothetical protein
MSIDTSQPSNHLFLRSSALSKHKNANPDKQHKESNSKQRKQSLTFQTSLFQTTNTQL